MAKTAKLQETNSTIRFSAKLLRPPAISKASQASTSQSFLILPKSASAKLPFLAPPPTQDVTMIEGTINGFPFRAALEPSSILPTPNGHGSHGLRLSKALHDAAGVSGGAEVGGTVTVEITRVGEEPEIRVPVDFRKALNAVPSVQTLWGTITPMAHRDWVLWIISAKQEETRRRRIENACDMLASGKRRPCCMPGINWRTKDSDVTPDETWLPLPSSRSRSSATSTKQKNAKIRRI